jgi:nitrite reductase/ring-hydroxylating ferredoxin subunit
VADEPVTGHDASAGRGDGNGRADPRQHVARSRVQTAAAGHTSADDPHAPLDRRVDSPGREGLTGTTPANIYKPLPDREQITVPPDWRPLHSQPVWRKDFPIDWPQDHYVARRDFTKFLSLTSLAFVVGQVWIGAQNVWRQSRGQPPVRRIALLSELPVGSVRQFHYPGEHDPCVLVRLAPDRLVAYGQKCTHLSCAVIPRVDKGHIHCPCHEGFFNLETGDVLAGPPPRPLPRVLIERRGDDVYATGIEHRTV